jgi:hypothetical protein
VWTPTQEDITLRTTAKAMAKQATKQGQIARSHTPSAKSTVLNGAIVGQGLNRELLKGVGKHTTAMDGALLSKHTRMLYDSCKRPEARVLAQLRTGMAQLSSYLHRIGVAESRECSCGQAEETVKHFLFCCIKWEQHRAAMLQQLDSKQGNLSFYLGGKERTDPATWKPNLAAV